MDRRIALFLAVVAVLAALLMLDLTGASARPGHSVRTVADVRAAVEKPQWPQEEEEEREREAEHPEFGETGTAAIEGLVENKAKAPIKGISVCVVNEKHGGHCARTNSEGKYAIVTLEAGTYTISVKVPKISEGLNYLPTSIGGVEVLEGKTTTALAITMEVGGEVSGTVKGAAKGEAIEHVLVCGIVETTPPGGEPVEEKEYLKKSCTESNGKGEYAIGSLASGEYEVRFQAYSLQGSLGGGRRLNYLNQYYNGVAAGPKAIESAARLTVTTGGKVEKIEALLLAGGQITGRVTDEAHAPIKGIEVCGENGTELFETEYNCVSTNANGEYDLIGLETGKYTVNVNQYDRTIEGVEYGHSVITGIEVTAGLTAGGRDAEVPFGTQPPKAAGRPTISGNAVVGETLLEHHAAWSGTVSEYGYQWERCSAAGTGCTAITGAVGQSYVLTIADEGHTISVQETAHNAHGEGKAFSLTTALVAARTAGGSGNGSPGGGLGAAEGGAQHLAANVAAASTTIKVSKGKATVRFTCAGNATCVGVATLLITLASRVHGHARKRHVRVGSVSFSISPGATSSAFIRLSSTGTSHLAAAHGRLAAILALSKTSPAPAQSSERAVRLIAQRARH